MLRPLRKILKENCAVLGVDIPELRIENSDFFVTPTTRAVTIIAEKNSIVINREYVPLLLQDDAEAWLVISHETRHIWQARYLKLNEYKNRKALPLLGYNEQELEIDAWAWACIAVVQNCNFRPDFTKLFGKDYDAKILARANDIIESKIL